MIRAASGIWENNVSVLTVRGLAERDLNPQRVDVPEARSATLGFCGCDSCELDIRTSGGRMPSSLDMAVVRRRLLVGTA